jgi:hypothetical protein
MGDFNLHAFALMTGKAQFSPLFGNQERILRCMGIVAGTTLSLLKRYVLHVAACLEFCWFMALVTKLAAFLGGRRIIKKGWRVVALLAGNFDHQGMHTRFQELGL